MRDADICIVGGGLAGLSAAYFLKRLSSSLRVSIFESSRSLGGLLRSAKVGDFLFDIGGSHIIFSRDDGILKEMISLLRGNYLRHRRNTKIYYKGILVKYPFENGLKDLPPEERFECLRDLVLNYIRRVKDELSPPTNFLEWVRYVFGDSIAEKYLIPYNQKLWKTDLREISLEWVGGRVPNPPLESVMKAAVGMDTEGYVHQLNFYYPRKGGIEALIKGLASKVVMEGIRIYLNTRVTNLLGGNKGVVVRGGDIEVKCAAVVYTAPLNRSAYILKDLLGRLSSRLAELRSVPLAVVGIGFKGDALPYHWIYFPSNRYVFHRVAFLSNYSPENTPKGASSIIAEISFPPSTDIRAINYEDLLRRTVEGLIQSGIIDDESRIATNRTWFWEDAYVLYDFKRSKILKSVKPALEEMGVFLHGRFGGWEYLNMDAVYGRSKDLALKVVRFVNNLSRG